MKQIVDTEFYERLDDYYEKYRLDPVKGLINFANTYLPHSLQRAYSKSQLEQLVTDMFFDESTGNLREYQAFLATVEDIMYEREMAQKRS